MKNILLTIVALVLTYSFAFSQTETDKLFLQYETKEVTVKEINFNSIKYTFPGEDVVYSISKMLVSKIEFSNGRSEEFRSPLQEVNSLKDAKKVFVTFNPSEIDGLDIVGDLFSKAVGVTTLSSVNNVNNRALLKLKTEAAMMGANALFIGNQFQRANQYGNENIPGNSTMTTYSAKAYTSNKLDMVAAKKMMENHKFYFHQKSELGRNDWSPIITAQQNVDKELNPILFDLGEILEKDGNLLVAPKDLKYKSEYLQLIRVGEDMITLMDRTDRSVINFDLLSDNHKLVKNQIKMVELRKQQEQRDSK
jgi:hypothetical protein